MYDTIGVRLNVSPSLAGNPAWQKVRTTLDPATGELHTRHIYNAVGHPQLTLLDGAELHIERSLPKALYGTNSRELAQRDVPEAINQLDGEVSKILRVDLPSVAELVPYRADYCENRQLPDEVAVRRLIRQAREVVFPRKGRPVVGQSGTSIAWPSKSMSFKLYGKFEESQEPGTEGIVRAESTVRHLGTFRDLLHAGRDTPIKLLDVLTPDVRTSVLSRFGDLAERFQMTQREMSNVSFASELLDYFPTSRVATLIGFCVLWQLSGSPSAVQVGRGEKRVLGYSRASVYRQLGDLRRFRKHLIEKGYESERLSDSSNRHEQGLDEVEELADRIARLREYLPAA